MTVVSDTSPLNYLILIGAIDILENLFSQVVIPQAVFFESQHARTPQRVKYWLAGAPPWLDVKQTYASSFSPSKRIGDGEREAIALAMDLTADAVLIDDRDGTQEARKQNLIALGTVNLLDRAAERHLLNLPEAIDRLRQTSFRLPPMEIIDAMLVRSRHVDKR